MTSSPLGPDFARALAGHSVQTGPVSGIWSCIGPCGASSIDRVDDVPTTKAEREEQHRAHLVDIIEAEIAAAKARQAAASEPCAEEKHSWDHFDSNSDVVDSYWMRCHRVGPHDEHENSETGATWTTS